MQVLTESYCAGRKQNDSKENKQWTGSPGDPVPQSLKPFETPEDTLGADHNLEWQRSPVYQGIKRP